MTGTTFDNCVAKVFDHLMRGAYIGTMADLAHASGVTYNQLCGVLGYVRSPLFMDTYEWTIPFVPKGPGLHTWKIVDTGASQDPAFVRESQLRRASELLTTTQRNKAQCQLALAPLDGRSAEAKHWRRAIVMFDAVEAHMEAILDGVGAGA